MLSLLIAHIIITVCCYWSGFLFYKFLPVTNKPRPAIYYLLSGLILLTAFTQIIVLFYPITIYTRLGIAGLLIILSFYKREKIKVFIPKIKFSAPLVLFVIVWVVILLINAGPTIMDDTDSYHIQSIKWIREWGSVPGLVNLHERFGFNSSWFSSVALFSFLPATTGGFTALNGVLSVWLCFWLISTFSSQKSENKRAAFSILVIFIGGLIFWPLLRGNAATANYDFITTCVVLVLFIEIFLSKEFSPSVEWIIWPVYLFTVRIVNFPLLILCLLAFVYYFSQKNSKTIFLPVVYCFLLIVPFIIRNVIIAGYPFYPATFFDFTNVDWKPDPRLTETLLEYIKYYNRVSTTYLEIEQTKALGADWIPSWFRYLFLFDKIIVVGGLAGIVSSLPKLFVSKDKPRTLLIIIALAWLICWFFISPDPRFVYGVLLFGIFLLVYHLTYFNRNAQIIKIAMNGLIIILIGWSAYYFVSKLSKQKEYANWVKPAQLPQPPVKELMIGEMILRIPESINNNWNARCYGTEIPCLYKIHPGLRPRGKNIQNGFRLEK